MYTPFTLKQEFENDLRKLITVKTVIEITGVYLDQRQKYYTSKKYGNYYYDKLKNSETEDEITLLVPVEQKVILTDGNIYKLRCLTEYKTKTDCSAELQLFVTDVIGRETTTDPRKQQAIKRKSELLRKFHTKKQENLSNVLKETIKKNQLPVIALIMGKNSKTMSDITAGLGGFRDKYVFEEYSVNIKNEQEIIKAFGRINQNKNIKATAIFRGGGSNEELSVFNSLSIAEAALELQHPFISAIAHADDEPFIERLASRSFITPTDFGNYLKETYINSGKEDDLNARENAVTARENRLEDKIGQVHSLELSLNKRNLKLQERETRVSASVNEDALQSPRLPNGREDYELYKSRVKVMAFGICAIMLLISLAIGTAAYFLSANFFSSPPAQSPVNNSSAPNANTNTSNSSNLKKNK